jgi:hypothetical protein
MLLDEINVFDENMFGERNEVPRARHEGYLEVHERIDDSS